MPDFEDGVLGKISGVATAMMMLAIPWVLISSLIYGRTPPRWVSSVGVVLMAPAVLGLLVLLLIGSVFVIIGIFSGD